VTVKVSEAVRTLPLASVAVQVTVWVPTANTDPLGADDVSVAEQLSNAAGAAQLTLAEHASEIGAIVAFTGTPAITGLMESRTTTYMVLVRLLALASEALTTTGVVPTENTEPFAGL
jgi:hypothetical protein